LRLFAYIWELFLNLGAPVLEVFDHIEAEVEESARIAENALSKLKFKPHLQRNFKTFVDIDEFLLEHSHLEGL